MRWMVIGFLKANFNFTACVAALGFSRTTIENLYHKYSSTGNIDDLPRSGRPSTKNEEILKDFILQQDHFQLFQTLAIQHYTNNARLKFKHFVEKPKLSEVHKKFRWHE